MPQVSLAGDPAPQIVAITLASGSHVLTRENQTTDVRLSSSVHSFQPLHAPIWLCMGNWKGALSGHLLTG